MKKLNNFFIDSSPINVNLKNISSSPAIIDAQIEELKNQEIDEECPSGIELEEFPESNEIEELKRSEVMSEMSDVGKITRLLKK